MAAAGYVNNDHDDNHDGSRQGNTYYGSSIRGADRDSKAKMEWRRRRDQPPPSAEELLCNIPSFQNIKKPSCIHGILHKCDSYRILKHIPSNIAVPFTLLYKVLK
jgi:hypothetical protein